MNTGTKHVGVRREYAREWIAYDRETGARIGPLHPTRYEAQAYAEHRQRTTYCQHDVRSDCEHYS